MWDSVEARVSRASPPSQAEPQSAVQAAPVAPATASAVAAASMEALAPVPPIARPPEPVEIPASTADEQPPASGAGKRAAAVTDDTASVDPVRPVPPAKPSPTKQWFVQVGAFASDANAQGVRVKLHATGLASTAQASDTPVGRLIRVRVGPFESKDEAERAALRIKAFELPAVLVRQ